MTPIMSRYGKIMENSKLANHESAMNSTKTATESPVRVSCVLDDAAWNKRRRGAAIPRTPAQKAVALRERQRAMIERAGLSHAGLGPAARAAPCKQIDQPNQRAHRAKQAHVKRPHAARIFTPCRLGLTARQYRPSTRRRAS